MGLVSGSKDIGRVTPFLHRLLRGSHQAQILNDRSQPRRFDSPGLGRRLHSVQHFAGEVAQFDVAPLGFVPESGERCTWITAMYRY